MGLPAQVKPDLIAPDNNGTVSNGSLNFSRTKTWKFTWTAVPNAADYQLYVMGANAANPTINAKGIIGTEYIKSDNGYIATHNLKGWTWKVRAPVNGRFMPWSEVRTFDVAPLN